MRTSSRNFGGSKSARGSRPGFLQLGEDVVAACSSPTSSADVALRDRCCPTSVGVAHERRDRHAEVLRHALDERVALGVHGARVERVLAAADAQEARACSKVRGPSPATSSSALRALERAVLVAVRDDALGQRRADARRRARAAARSRCSARRRPRSRSSRRPRRASCASSGWYTSCWYCPTPMLFGIDLHQLGQRILQAARDARSRRAPSGRDRGTPRARRRTPSRRSRPPRSPARRARRSSPLACEHLAHEGLGLAAVRAVADGDRARAVLACSSSRRALRARARARRRPAPGRASCARGACPVSSTHRALAAGALAGIDAEHRLRAAAARRAAARAGSARRRRPRRDRPQLQLDAHVALDARQRAGACTRRRRPCASSRRPGRLRR